MYPIEWHGRAKCRKDGVSPDFFYPEAPSGRSKGGTLDDRQAQAAKYCHGYSDGKPCSVRLDCLEYALETRQDAGVWGGCTEEERLRIRRKRRKMTA